MRAGIPDGLLRKSSMSRKKISTTIYVTPEQSERLRLLHDRTKVPVAVYIREGIDLVLRHYGHLLPGQLPLDAGPRDNARQTGQTGQTGQAAWSGRSPSSTDRASRDGAGGDPGDSDEIDPAPSS